MIVETLSAFIWDQLDDTRAVILERGGRSVVLPGDVSAREDTERIVKTMMQPYGALDILVNKAGVHTAVGPVGEDDPEAWWHDVTQNLRGAYLLCRAALPFMRPGGTIINVSSGAGMKAFPYSNAYSASKAALIHFTETLHLDLASKGISVFAIRPGTVRTSIVELRFREKTAGRDTGNHVRGTGDRICSRIPEKSDPVGHWVCGYHCRFEKLSRFTRNRSIDPRWGLQ